MNTGIAFWKQKGRPASNGGVAQLGEHLPCKQGVKSSNLSISIRNLMIKFRDTYLENRILNRNDWLFNWISRHPRPCDQVIDHVENNTTNFVNNPDQKMQRYASEMSSLLPQAKVSWSS